MKWVNNIAFERYAYDAAGRMVREGNKIYRYGYLDKVLSVTDGYTTRAFTYHADGQLASASLVGTGASPVRNEPETFLWDGLALIQRGDEQFVNEPHVGGGNPVASSKGTSYFNDALGTTVGSKSNGKYSAVALTAFGENVSVDSPTQNSNFFTGKPYVEGLGHAFLMRNSRAGLAKWQSADPMGYPDGWNQLAYCNNGVTSAVDLWGCKTKDRKREPHILDNPQPVIWTCPQDNDMSYGYTYTGVCDGSGHISETHEEIDECLQGSLMVNAPGMFNNMASPYVTYSDFKVEEVPNTRRSGEGYLQFEVHITYNVKYKHWVDKANKVEDYVTKKFYTENQIIRFECHHKE